MSMRSRSSDFETVQGLILYKSCISKPKQRNNVQNNMTWCAQMAIVTKT